MNHTSLTLVACALSLLATPAFALSARVHGEALVKARCAPCHAIGRTGDSPDVLAPPLRAIAAKYRIEDLEEAFAEGIMVGHRSETMPAFELTPAQIEGLGAYLRSLKR
jgi:mono/diheme cytochrome c family protein